MNVIYTIDDLHRVIGLLSTLRDTTIQDKVEQVVDTVISILGEGKVFNDK